MALLAGCALEPGAATLSDGQVDDAGDAAQPNAARPDVALDATVAQDATVPRDAEPDAAQADAAPDAAAPDAATPAACPCPEDASALRCGAEAAAEAEAAGCSIPLAAEHPTDLLACRDGAWRVAEACAEGCQPGEPAACALPECACFVQVAWCGEGAAREGLSRDPPCRVPLSPAHDGDILGCRDGAWIVQRRCEDGCFQAPRGTPDACNEELVATPQDPGWADCPHRGLLARGLHPEASDRLRCAGVTADRISQTIGNAAASAGYHAADGQADGLDYCAAVDLRTRDLTRAQIRALLERLASHGFAAWYREPGADGWPADEAPHIHAVFAGVRMKAQLQGQVRDFLRGLNGLASHRAYAFWSPTAASLAIVRLLFQRRYNP
ncbi:MAG: hypothetical protein R3F60_31480 [bacterium]